MEDSQLKCHHEKQVKSFNKGVISWLCHHCLQSSVSPPNSTTLTRNRYYTVSDSSHTGSRLFQQPSLLCYYLEAVGFNMENLTNGGGLPKDSSHRHNKHQLQTATKLGFKIDQDNFYYLV